MTGTAQPGRHHTRRPLGDRPWTTEAACADTHPDLFFPGSGDVHTERAAKAICRTCPVIDDCQNTHMGEDHGVWFATTARERVRLRRQQRQKQTR